MKQEQNEKYLCDKCKYRNESDMSAICLECAFSDCSKNFEEENDETYSV